MEALAGLAAFGVACNVMQTIHFSLEACTACKRVWEGNSPAPELDDHRAAIQRAAQDLQQSLPSASQGPGSLGEPELRKVAEDIIKIANELKKELDSGKASGSSRYYHVIGIVFKYIMVKSHRINKLFDSLKGLQDIMELKILINLREKLKLHHTFIEQRLDDIDRKTQDFMQQLNAGNTALDSLINRASGEIRLAVERETERSRAQASANTRAMNDVVVGESQVTRNHVKSSFNEHRSMRIQSNQADVLLRSLRYPQMNARKNASAINSNHRGTYQWIFEDDQRAEAIPKEEHHNFGDWLRSNKSIYWISGKAGSGKSSLIRQLIDDNRTETFLQQWRKDAKILSAFIWNAGSDMQKSQVGLLATLLHQLLSVDEHAAVQHLLEDAAMRSKETILDWSKSELLQALKKTFNSKHIAACFFIDGLDEIDAREHDGAFGLLDLLEDLSSHPNIKMCLGSREEPILIDRLDLYPRLRLQNLTRDDMHLYVEHSLGSKYMTSSVQLTTREQLSVLVEIIVSQADGVFLWVYLVTKSIRTGLIHHDDWDCLIRRISILPTDLSGLYKEMFKRLHGGDQELYQAETALYFNEVLKERVWDDTLFVLLLKSRPSVLRSFLSGGVEITEEYVTEQCKIVRRQILAKCAGLLEVPAPQDVTANMFEIHVNFIHRSARDFLVDTRDGQKILGHDKRSPAEREWAAMLAHMLGAAYILPVYFPSPWPIFRLLFHDHVRSPLFSRTSLELPISDLLSSFMKRRFPCLEVDNAMLEFAALTGASHFVKRYMESRSSYPHSYISNWKSNLLRCVCNFFKEVGFPALEYSWQKRASLISWLLHEGADPNSPPSGIVSSSVRSGLYQTPFVLFFQELSFALDYDSKSHTFQNAYMRLACEFIEHGGDTGTRTLQNATGRQICCFGNIWKWMTMIRGAVLVEMSICHMFWGVQQKLVEWIEGCDQPEERKKKLRILLDDQNTEPPKIVLIGKRTACSDGESVKMRNSFLPVNLEVPIASEALVEEMEEKCTLDYCRFPLDKKYKLDYSDFPLDEKGAVEWLVSQGYLPQEGAVSENPGEVLQLDDRRMNDSNEDKVDYSAMDWSYKREYDNFLAAVKQEASSRNESFSFFDR